MLVVVSEPGCNNVVAIIQCHEPSAWIGMDRRGETTRARHQREEIKRKNARHLEDCMLYTTWPSFDHKVG